MTPHRSDAGEQPRSNMLLVSLVSLAFIAQFALGSTALGAPKPSSAGTPAASGGVITFGVQPAGPKQPDGRSYFSFSVTDGAHLSDHIAVTNYSFQRLTLTLHSSDALNTVQGDFALLPPNQRSTQVGRWIKIPSAGKTLHIPPRGTVIVPFTVVVPHTVQPGDHAGGIIATLESTARSQSGQLYHLLQNVGARVFVRVSGVLRPLLTVEAVKIGYRGTLNPFGTGTARVTFTVHNAGNVALGGTQIIQVSGLLGMSSLAKGVKQLGLLLPGSRVTESVDVAGVFPQIWMTAHVAIKPLTLPGALQTMPGPFEASTHFWAVPLMLLLILVLLIGLFWSLRSRHHIPRSKRRDSKGKSSSNDSAGQAEQVQASRGT